MTVRETLSDDFEAPASPSIKSAASSGAVSSGLASCIPAEPNWMPVSIVDPGLAAELVQPEGPSRVHFTLDKDGWTHKFEGGVNTHTEKSDDVIAEIPKGLTPAEATENYDTILAHFQQSMNCADMTGFFENVLLKLPNLQLSSYICAGLGTFTGAHPYCSENPEPSMYQLAAAETMLAILRRKFRIETAYIQDPVMNIVDEQLAASRGFTVLYHPEAMNAMASTTFLYTPSCEWWVIDHLLSVAFPAVYLGQTLEDYRTYITIVPGCLVDEAEAGRGSSESVREALVSGEGESKGKLVTNAEVTENMFNSYARARSSRVLALDPTDSENTERMYWSED